MWRTGSQDKRRIRCYRDLIFVLSVDYTDESVSLGWGEVNIWANRDNWCCVGNQTALRWCWLLAVIACCWTGGQEMDLCPISQQLPVMDRGIYSPLLQIVFSCSRKWREVAIPYVRCGFLGKWHPGSDEEEVRSTGSLSPGLRCQSNAEVPEHRSLVMLHTGMLLRMCCPISGWVSCYCSREDVTGKL